MERWREREMSGEEGDCYGVLLYYKYYYGAVEKEKEKEQLEALKSFYNSNCHSLSLLGRVRLSPSGVNVTVGGQVRALEKHIEALKCVGGGNLFEGTDFKLATCAAAAAAASPLSLATHTGFTSLSIRIVKELVTFSSYPLLNPPHISNAGIHLSALDFHSLLHNSGQVLDNTSLTDNQELLLFDARNLYETRIGKFQMPGVQTLDPGIRQYSDLSSWIDHHAEQLRGKQVLMYCTGGIRCEMASAYIKTKGAGFENVFQLFGGIQRYLEQFPDGGFFKGKNFVFDHRISVGSSDTTVLGTCLLCGVSFDDYSSRCRCFHCRMLVLICDNCQMREAIYLCELCRKHNKNVGKTYLIGDGKPEEIIPGFKPRTMTSETILSHQLDQGKGAGRSRKLRILCLHGFRQNASSFKGRTASLAKKLRNMAELFYVDAPHELPFIYQPCATESFHCSSRFPSERVPPIKCHRKFAWLTGHDYNGMSENEWKMSDAIFDPLQYQQQTEGFDVSLAYLKTVFSQQGPFDGILGFSQGAAMTALVCAQKERLKDQMDFRFAILCSGFAPHLGEIPFGSVNCPSLHIFGSLVGKDRQIATHASRDLALLFVEDCSEIVEHDCGHIIPTRPPFIDKIKSFLQSFV